MYISVSICLISAEDYEDIRDISTDNESPVHSVVNDAVALGQGRLHGDSQGLVDWPLTARFSRHHNKPLFRRPLTAFDYWRSAQYKRNM